MVPEIAQAWHCEDMRPADGSDLLADRRTVEWP
jgi:hypothetical protein